MVRPPGSTLTVVVGSWVAPAKATTGVAAVATIASAANAAHKSDGRG
ncbi:MAG: hypothetical protein ACLPXZ_27200 [Mycobacterium sp.]